MIAKMLLSKFFLNLHLCFEKDKLNPIRILIRETGCCGLLGLSYHRLQDLKQEFELKFDDIEFKSYHMRNEDVVNKLINEVSYNLYKYDINICNLIIILRIKESSIYSVTQFFLDFYFLYLNKII